MKMCTFIVYTCTYVALASLTSSRCSSHGRSKVWLPFHTLSWLSALQTLIVQSICMVVILYQRYNSRNVLEGQRLVTHVCTRYVCTEWASTSIREHIPLNTRKKPTGTFDGSHLLQYLKTQAVESKMGKDCVPFVKKTPKEAPVQVQLTSYMYIGIGYKKTCTYAC